MTPKRLPINITIAFVVLVSVFIYASFISHTTIQNYSTWQQYGGGPDQSKYLHASLAVVIPLRFTRALAPSGLIGAAPKN
jgi:hypothetical protein